MLVKIYNICCFWFSCFLSACIFYLGLSSLPPSLCHAHTHTHTHTHTLIRFLLFIFLDFIFPKHKNTQRDQIIFWLTILDLSSSFQSNFISTYCLRTLFNSLLKLYLNNSIKLNLDVKGFKSKFNWISSKLRIFFSSG